MTGRIKTYRLLTLFGIGLLWLWGSAPVYSQGVVPTILPLGDSITQGFGGQPSYRRALWFKMIDEGYTVDFVGSLTTFAGSVPIELQDFDLDHEGHSGWQAGQLDANIAQFLQAYDADIVLLHAGTNDLATGQDITSTLNELGGIIAKLRNDNPNIIILLAQIIPGQTLDTSQFNSELASWAQGQNTADSPVVVVDQETGYDPLLDNYDNYHPNNVGEDKIATRWLETLLTILTPGNRKPLVDAGGGQRVDSTSELVTLLGSASDDGLPGPALTYEWSMVSGPGTVTFGNPDAAVTDVSFSQDGGYELRLEATDSELTGADEILIQVGSLPGLAGHWSLDETTGTTAQDQSANGNDGTLQNLDASNWQTGRYNNGLCLEGLNGQQVAIPDAGNGLQPASLTIAGWVRPDPAHSTWSWVAGQGDNYGLYTQGDAVHFYFYNGASWQNVGESNTAVRDGQWHHVAGTFAAATGTFAVYLDGELLDSASAPASIVHAFGNGFSLGSMQGGRNFKGCLDEIVVYDRALEPLEIGLLMLEPGPPAPVNQAPSVDAGPDETIQLPVDTVQISAQIDDDGLPVDSTPDYTWTQQSGPGTALFSEVDFTGGALTTDITLDLPGDYVLVLEATDGDLSASDEIQITLVSESAVNEAPQVNAGPDQTIQLPVDTVQIDAQLTDDGLPVDSTLGYTWTQQSGPGTATFSEAGFSGGVLTTDVTLDLPGDYFLMIEATDGDLSASDEVMVTLLEPVNQAPSVDTGLDQVIQLPVNTVQITAQVSDDGLPDGSMLSYTWTQQSGPGTATFSEVSFIDELLTTDIGLDLPGNYVLVLEAGDGDLSASDELQVTLLDENQPPIDSPFLSDVVGFWRLDELSGTLAVDSGAAANNGTLQNLDISSWQPGVYNNGLCLEATSGQQVVIPGASNGLQPASVTVAGWVRPDPTHTVWSWVAGQGDNYGLFTQADEIFFYFYNGAAWKFVSFDGTAVRDGQWHHLAGTFDAVTGDTAIYMDGVVLNSASFTDAIVYSFGDAFSIGSMQGQRNFNGCLDEIQVYARALSPAEIATLAQEPGVEPPVGPPILEAQPSPAGNTVLLPDYRPVTGVWADRQDVSKGP